MECNLPIHWSGFDKCALGHHRAVPGKHYLYYLVNWSTHFPLFIVEHSNPRKLSQTFLRYDIQ